MIDVLMIQFRNWPTLIFNSYIHEEFDDIRQQDIQVLGG